MRLIKFTFLSEYRQFKSGSTFIFSQSNSVNSAITVIAGRNGSGKTTLMSTIVNLFYQLERYNKMINFNCELVYTITPIGNTSPVLVTITHKSNRVTITVPGIFSNSLLVPMRAAHTPHRAFQLENQNNIFFHELIPFLPSKVVTSEFSIHGEYPRSRSDQYQGTKMIVSYPISSIYGDNHFKLGSISKGIFRFLKEYLLPNSRLRTLLSKFDIECTGKVLCREYRFSTEVWSRVVIDKSRWQQATMDWLYEDDLLSHTFLNDLEFRRNGKLISLANMSSGEKMLLLRMLSILNSIEQNSLVFIEEPELHLDQAWNRQLFALLKYIYSGYNSHIIIASHDYGIINSVENECLMVLNNGKQEQSDTLGKTFLASYDELFNVLFGDNFRMNEVEELTLEDISRNSSIDDLRESYEKMGNSIYKYLVHKKIKELSAHVENS